MANRLNLQAELQTIIGIRADGKQNVYFQPPESIKLVYPCIVYKRSSADQKYADNKTYNYTFAYNVTVISKDADDPLVEKILKTFELCRYNNRFASDNLYHDVFTIYY